MIIGNRYQLQSEIGEGGMGTVYKGIDTRTDEPVAIKLLKAQTVANSPDMLERFQREAEALRELNHPNIVKMLDILEKDNKHYLIMEYVSGGDLADLIQSGNIAINRVIEIAIDLADALTRTHKLGIIHRDLKPANALIANDGTLRLTDFGIAHSAKYQKITETNAIVGTPHYLPPEVLDGEQADNRSDIWAFGVMLFEMLTGKNPFDGDSLMAIVRSIVSDPVPDLEQLNPDCPIALVDLVYRMLEKDRIGRIRSVRHVGAALEDILQGVAVVGGVRERPVVSQETRKFDTPTPGYDERPKHNLPLQTTPFVGREHELDELSKLIDNPDMRLITVLAPGGMGKSRLAIAIGERYIGQYTNGVYFVELAPLSSAENIPSAIASVTGYQFQPDERTPRQQIIDYLTNKHMLLIMDNYEHLLDGSDLVSDILKTASNVTVLATSRQRLSQSGETLFHLSGMDFPEWETPDDALNYAAVKLFVNSAKRARPDFELTNDNMDYVARICKLVQGMPLGIVLAASWSGMLTPEEITAELTHSLDFLETDETELPERQRSMRAVMDYSWQQMTEAEQQVFMKLSVFRGGFTREAAQEVAGASLRILMSLVNKSLIRRDTDTGRYEIHELLRQYAEDIVSDIEPIRYAHAVYFRDWVSNSTERFDSHLQVEVMRAIDADYANIRIAWLYFINSGQITEISGMIHVFQQFVMNNAYYVDAVQLFSQAVVKVRGISPSQQRDILLGNLLACYAYMGWFTGEYNSGKANAQEAINLLASYEAYAEKSLSYLALAWMEYFLANFDEAHDAANEGVYFARCCDNRDYEVWNLWIRANILIAQAKYEQASIMIEDMVALSLQMGKTNRIGSALLTKAQLLMKTKQYNLANNTLDLALEHFKYGNFNWGFNSVYNLKSNIAFEQGNYIEAQHLIVKTLQLQLVSLNQRHLFGSIIHWAKILLKLNNIALLAPILIRIHNETNFKIIQTNISNILEQVPEDIYETALQNVTDTDLETLIQQLINDFYKREQQ